MTIGATIPLCPETAKGGKSTKFTPAAARDSAAEEATWYRGDPTKQRVVQSKHHGNEDGFGIESTLMKSLLQGEYYDLRQNGFSSIHDSAKVPKHSTDGSYFQPGVKAEMTKQQERAFFKLQVHDENNRSYMSRVIKAEYLYGDMKTHPKLAISNIIARNRLEASKPNSRSRSAMQKRIGELRLRNDWRSPQRQVAERIAKESCELFEKNALLDVTEFLTKTSKESRESLEGLFGSILSNASQRSLRSSNNVRPLSPVLGCTDGTVRPGTAAIMERSERDQQRAVDRLHKSSQRPGTSTSRLTLSSMLHCIFDLSIFLCDTFRWESDGTTM